RAATTRKAMQMTRNVLIGLAVAVVGIVGVLFATGFWSANVKDAGKLPEVNISAEPGRAPGAPRGPRTCCTAAAGPPRSTPSTTS
ncbi:hypothetical protein B4Q13_15595, partial [Lacticaseibacillus rhamnosus]